MWGEEDEEEGVSGAQRKIGAFITRNFNVGREPPLSLAEPDSLSH